MSVQQKQRRGNRAKALPTVAAGDHVLIGYCGNLDPHFWWISEVAWTDGINILVFDGTGSHPSRAPTLNLVENVIAVGTGAKCLAVMIAADRAARQLDAPIRDANVALSAAQDKSARSLSRGREGGDRIGRGRTRACRTERRGMRRDNRKRLELTCTACQGAGTGDYGYARGRCHARCRECRGTGRVKIANPAYVAPGELPTWFQLGGGEGWAREIRRQLALGDGRCWRSRQAKQFKAICAIIAPWRIRSAVHCNSLALAAIAPLIEQAHRNHGRLERPGTMFADTGWTAAELGELLVEVRNRQHLWSLGRTQAKPRGPRFDPARIPDDRLDALIQRHPNLGLVERLRAERSARHHGAAHG